MVPGDEIISKKSIIFIVLTIILCFVTLIISALYLLNDFCEYQDFSEDIEDLKKEIIIEETANSADTKIDFESLKNINNDIIGWIKVGGTAIDYPILQSDNSYYLEHSYNKKYNANGSIFTFDNTLCQTPQTIIYGHNRRNGLMFAELSKYMEKDFFEKHQEFYIYTPDKTYKANIFSVYSINVFTEKSNTESKDFNEQIEYYQSKSMYKVDTNNSIKKIVKLSTCSYLNTLKRPTDQRYYVIANIEEI